MRKVVYNMTESRLGSIQFKSYSIIKHRIAKRLRNIQQKKQHKFHPEYISILFINVESQRLRIWGVKENVNT